MARSKSKRKRKSFAGLVLFLSTMLFAAIVKILKSTLGIVWGLIKFSPRAILYGIIILVAIGYGNMFVLAMISVLLILYELFRRGWVKA